jgi:hypothetical protein
VAERSQAIRITVRRLAVEKSNHRHRRLLRSLTLLELQSDGERVRRVFEEANALRAKMPPASAGNRSLNLQTR